MSVLMDESSQLVHILCRPNRRLGLDPITDLFHTMHVTSVVHARLEATAPLLREPEDVKEAVPHSCAR